MLTLRTSKNKNDVKNLPITISLILVNFHNFVLSHWPIGTESERVICWVMWIEASVGLGGECGASPAWANKELLAGQAQSAHTPWQSIFLLSDPRVQIGLALSRLCVLTNAYLRNSRRGASQPDTPALQVESYIKRPRVKRSEGEEKAQRRF